MWKDIESKSSVGQNSGALEVLIGLFTVVIRACEW